MNNSELRKIGDNLLKEGCALIDTSGRTKNLFEKSVTALASRKFNYSILMSSKEKQKVCKKLIESNNSDERAKAIIHSVKLYYLVKDYLDICSAIYICSDGFDCGLLKHYLKKLMNVSYHEQKINIVPSLKKMFGKRNLADRLAYSVSKGEKAPNFILQEKHFKKLNLI